VRDQKSVSARPEAQGTDDAIIRAKAMLVEAGTKRLVMKQKEIAEKLGLPQGT
jgi:hypothetical protein